MPVIEQRRDVLCQKQTAEHVKERDYPYDACDSPERMYEAVSKQGHDHDEGAEQYDATAVIDAEQLPERLPSQHAAAGGKPDIHEAYGRDRNHGAVDTELHTAGDHLWQSELW